MSRTRTAPALTAVSAATALVVLALGGCGGGGGAGGSDGMVPGGEGEPSVGAVPRLLSTASLAFPLDSYIASADQRSELSSAQAVLVSACMKRYGFTYTMPEDPEADRGPGSDNSRRYGLTDAKAAATRGYAHRGQPPAKDGQAGGGLSANGELVLYGADLKNPADLPASWEEEQAAMEAGAAKKGAAAVNGRAVPVGGCLHESALKLYAPKKGAVEITFTQGLRSQAYTRSRQDSRVVKATRAWSACMADAGYRSTNPVSPQADLGFTTEAAMSSARGVAAAKADVACKEKVNLVGIWYTVEVAYQKRAVEENAERLAQARTELDDRMKLAASLTA